ncbi:MAG: tellurite resistance TerB family protein [Pseudomonadota bacterium]
MSAISTHHALIYVMVLVAAADGDMRDEELQRIGNAVKHLPVFDGFPEEMLMLASQECAELLAADGGLDAVRALVKDAIPDGISDTAYALACDIALADHRVAQEELRLLDMLRHDLEMDRLTSAAIERAATARARRLPTES